MRFWKVMLSVRGPALRARLKSPALVRGIARKAPIARDITPSPTKWGYQRYSRERRAPRSWEEVSGGWARCVLGVTYDDHEDEHCVDPSDVQCQDEEARLEHHPEVEPDTSENFVEPVLRRLCRYVQLDLPASDHPVDCIFGINNLGEGATIGRAARLRSDYVETQNRSQQNHDDVESPGWIQVRDNASAGQEAQRDGADEAPYP